MVSVAAPARSAWATSRRPSGISIHRHRPGFCDQLRLLWSSTALVGGPVRDRSPVRPVRAAVAVDLTPDDRLVPTDQVTDLGVGSRLRKATVMTARSSLVNGRRRRGGSPGPLPGSRTAALPASPPRRPGCICSSTGADARHHRPADWCDTPTDAAAPSSDIPAAINSNSSSTSSSGNHLAIATTTCQVALLRPTDSADGSEQKVVRADGIQRSTRVTRREYADSRPYGRNSAVHPRHAPAARRLSSVRTTISPDATSASRKSSARTEFGGPPA